ncbi:hypothetical protein BH10PSE1_BH10PSE1_27770 [soil metagenome]
MRRAFSVSAAAMAALVVFAGALPTVADAQTGGAPGQSGTRNRQPGTQQQADGQDTDTGPRAPRVAPLSQRANAGPCPFVKILYDAARYVELTDNRAAVANVGYTGEIEGVSSGCSYRDHDPITVQANLLFNLGRGPQATADQRTYRYWIAVTARNEAVLAKEYFDLPVDFKDARTASVTEERTIVIPRANTDVSGANFEVLIGFDITPEMATFNRDGSRFRANAGATPVAPTVTPPAQ